jgi:hypothetical protein
VNAAVGCAGGNLLRAISLSAFLVFSANLGVTSLIILDRRASSSLGLFKCLLTLQSLRAWPCSELENSNSPVSRRIKRTLTEYVDEILMLSKFVSGCLTRTDS